MAVPTRVTERYEFREVLGEGGMGVVYRAYDRVVGREVAIKTIRDVQDKASLDLFRRECSVLANFAHPHIVEIFDFGELEETGTRKPFFVMPLLDGLTLDKLIHSETETLSVERCVDIISQVCRGLQAAHERGLVHRDLKPTNIFILRGDSVKIIDFGVAHMVDTQSSVGLKGTLMYMAPEQVLMKRPTALTDLFSLGVVCFEILARRRPFDGATRDEIAEQIVKVIPPPASQFNPAVSLAVSQVIHKALAKQPYHRFSSVKEFAEALNKAYRNEPVDCLNPDRIEPRVVRARKAFEQGELEFASEIVGELESEALLHPDIVELRKQIDAAIREKNVQQLLDTARRRFGEDEYQLALQKVQEVLNLDPSNTDAHALKGDIENKRSSAQIDEWFKVAWQHMENHSYRQARKALNDVLQLRPKEQRAQQLLAEVDRREQDYLRIRKEKEDAYQAAIEARRRGDLSSAMTKLERVLEMDRRAPDTFAPDRAAIYQKTYNEVRSEYDLLASLFSEVRQNFESGNLVVAAKLCKEALEKYPGHAMFQSMKLDIEVRQRQELSALIARIDREVDDQPDLSNKVRILEKALQQHPDEVHFQQSLQTIKSKRDLVDSIVTAARGLEDRGLFAEALDKWEILQSIYPKYPALDFELERVRKRREAKDRQQAKAVWVDRIDRCRQSGEYDRALTLVADAVQEFPSDPELLTLEKAVRHSLERAADSQRLVEEGRAAWQDGRHDEGLQLFRQAYETDPASTTARAALLDALIAAARNRIDSNWQQADQLLQQVLELDPRNPMATSLQQLVNDKREDEFVTGVLSEARRHDAEGRVQQALTAIEEACKLYPSNGRLSQFRMALKRRLPQPAQDEMRRQDLESLRQLERDIAGAASPGDMLSIFQRTSVLAAEYAGDRDFEMLATKIKDKVEKESVPAPPPAPAAAPAVVEPAPPQAGILDRLKPSLDKAQVRVNSLAGSLKTRYDESSPEQRRLMAAFAVILVLVGLSVAYQKKNPKPAATPPVAATLVPMQVKVEPADATFQVLDDHQSDVTHAIAGLVPGRYTVRASRPGYKPAETALDVSPPGPAVATISLMAIPSSFELQSTQDGLTVTLDGRPLTDSGGGRYGLEPLPDSEHRLDVASRGGTATLVFSNKPAAIPEIVSFESRGLQGLAIVQFGNLVLAKRSVGPTSRVEVGFDSDAMETLGPDGAQRSFTDVAAHTVRFATADSPEQSTSVVTGSGPRIQVIIPGRQGGYLIVDAGSPDIKLSVNGRTVNTAAVGKSTARIVTLKPGQYTVTVERDGYEPAQIKALVIHPGSNPRQVVTLKEIVKNATLVIQNGKDTEVIVNGQTYKVTTDRFSITVPPGSHKIVLRRDGYDDLSVTRDFPKGQQIAFDAQVMKKQVVPARVTFRPVPQNASLTLRRLGSPAQIPIKDGVAELPEGSYMVSAAAPEYEDKSQPFNVQPSQTAILIDIALARKVVPVAEAPKAAASPMQGWPQSAGWRKQGDRYVREKNSLVIYSSGSGTFEFTTPCKKVLGFAGDCKAEVLAGYTNRSYISFIITRKSIEKRVVSEDGPPIREHSEHRLQLPSELHLRITITAAKAQVLARVGGKWVLLAEHEDPKGQLTNGRFALRDVNELSGFSHTAN